MRTKLLAAIVAAGCFLGLQPSAFAQAGLIYRGNSLPGIQTDAPTAPPSVHGRSRVLDNYYHYNKDAQRSGVRRSLRPISAN